MAVDRIESDMRRWLVAINESGHDVPAHGIVQVTSGDHPELGAVVVKVDRPRQPGFPFAVADASGMRSGNPGMITMDWPAMARLPTDFAVSAEPSDGDNWGVDDKKFELSPNGADRKALLGFHCHGVTVEQNAIRRTLVSAFQPQNPTAIATKDIKPGYPGEFALDSYGSRIVDGYAVGTQSVAKETPVILCWDNSTFRFNALTVGATDLIKKAKSMVEIKPGSSGSAEIFEGGRPTGSRVDAWLNWMHNNEPISSGKEMLIKWFPDEGKWVIIGAECEEKEENGGGGGPGYTGNPG